VLHVGVAGVSRHPRVVHMRLMYSIYRDVDIETKNVIAQQTKLVLKNRG
jgi:hypothetical protein